MDTTFNFNFTANNNLSRNGSNTFPRLSVQFLTPEEQEGIRVALIMSYLIIGLVSLLGNTSLLAVVYLNHHMRIPANYYIVNMAISDLLIDIIVLPDFLEKQFSRSEDMWTVGVVGEILCKLVPFVLNSSLAISILSMTAISVDRFFAVVFPLKPKPLYTKTKIVIPLIWFTGMAFNSFYWYINRLEPAPYCVEKWPTEDSFFYMYYFVIGFFFVFPLVIMAVLYSIIIYKIKHHTIPGHRTSEMEKARRNRNKNITRLGVLIVLCFFISWLPYHVFFILSKQRILPPRFLLLIAKPTCIALAMSTIASNPIVCYICSTNFRKCLLKLLRCSSEEQQQQGIVLNTSERMRELTGNNSKDNNTGISNCAYHENSSRGSISRNGEMETTRL